MRRYYTATAADYDVENRFTGGRQRNYIFLSRVWVFVFFIVCRRPLCVRMGRLSSGLSFHQLSFFRVEELHTGNVCVTHVILIACTEYDGGEAMENRRMYSSWLLYHQLSRSSAHLESPTEHGAINTLVLRTCKNNARLPACQEGLQC
jgi:hypothetical protein